MDKEFLSVKDVVHVLGVSESTVRRFIRQKELPAEKIHNKLQIPLSHVLQLKDRREQAEQAQKTFDQELEHQAQTEPPPAIALSRDDIQAIIHEELHQALEHIPTGDDLAEMIRGAIRDELRALEPPTMAAIPTTADIEIEPEPPAVIRDPWARRLLIAFRGAIATLKRGLDAMIEPPEPPGDENEE